MSFERHVDDAGITLTLSSRRGLFRRGPSTIDEAAKQDRELMLALTELRLGADELGESVEIDQTTIRLSHRLAASLPAQMARAIGLPSPMPFTFATETEGVIGSTSFRLRARFLHRGREIPSGRIGAILTADGSDWLLPRAVLDALDVAKALGSGAALERQWEALACFRRALDPEAPIGSSDFAGRIEMSGFLRNLRIRVAEGFSISPKGDLSDFDPVPFARNPEGPEGPELPSEAESVLDGAELAEFQKRVRGPLGDAPAYRVGEGTYLVVDPGARPALNVMASMQRASADARAAFVRNPNPALDQAYEAWLRDTGRLDDLDDRQQQEAIETETGARFVQTREYSERVLGTGVWTPPVLPPGTLRGMDWMPDDIALTNALARLRDLPDDAVEPAIEAIGKARAEGKAEAQLPGHSPIPATEAAERILRARLEGPATPPDKPDRLPSAPEVLLTRTNIWEEDYLAAIEPRSPVDPAPSSRLASTPLPHQIEALRWQAEAWSAGLPGVLNADEQGLGKTFETLGFLAWLQDRMEAGEEERRPILVVAPTSLLETWEAEVARHLGPGGLGDLVRLYGKDLARNRRSDGRLDLPALDNAQRDGRAHRFWLLVTYQTLTDYLSDLAGRSFAAVVFDEIQNLKNPGTLRANAARAVKARFRIGLTGTPVENAMSELWAIMDQVAPGGLGTLRGFLDRHGKADGEGLAELHRGLFEPQRGLPPGAMRRLKSEVARDLIPKQRRLHPGLMPKEQAEAYANARDHLLLEVPGAVFKMLHHIRGVSAHPDLDGDKAGAEFIAQSARLDAAFRVLDGIRERRERALVFIESLRLQARFVALAQARYGLTRIDVINGSTPIPKRQAAVDRFQRHLARDEGFDLLVLGPRAAGVGLTLTAATHVIHVSRWWNPAVEEQCNDRVHRIGQTKPVTVHLPMAIHPEFRERSFDCLLEVLMARKRSLAVSVLSPMGDRPEDAEALRQGLSRERPDAQGDPLGAALAAMFEAIGRPMPQPDADGSIRLEA